MLQQDMRFALLDSLTLPGNPDKANEDAFAQDSGMAVVFDGATGLGESLMPGPSDAGWLAQFGARRLRARAADGGNPRGWIEGAAQDAAKSFAALRRRAPRERYEVPVSSLMLAALADDAIEFLWLGDCAAMLRPPNGDVQIFGDAIESKARERERVARLALAENLKPASKVARDEFLPALRAKRNQVNTAKGGWLFAPDARCAKHARVGKASAAPGTVLLLASDGFLALVSDYDRYTATSLMDAAGKGGLARLGQESRAIEADDAEGVKFPRFKQSDDATALLLRVA